MDRPWIEAGLKYSLVREPDLPALLVQRVARLRGCERLDTRFLYYVIGCRDFTQYVISVQTGTAVPHISAQQIKEFTFPLPPLSEQRVIAHILGTLDDKIELNRRMNETLEAMARALFKSWFVRFRPRPRQDGRPRPLPGIRYLGLVPGHPRQRGHAGWVEQQAPRRSRRVPEWSCTTEVPRVRRATQLAGRKNCGTAQRHNTKVWPRPPATFQTSILSEMEISCFHGLVAYSQGFGPKVRAPLTSISLR